MQSEQCLECFHYGNGDKPGIQRCAAFRGLIPDDIFHGEFDHVEPFGGELKIEGDLVLFERLTTANSSSFWVLVVRPA